MLSTEFESAMDGSIPSVSTSSQSSTISSLNDVVVGVLTDELSNLTSACLEFSRNAIEAQERARELNEAYEVLKSRTAALEVALEDRNGRVKAAKLEADRANAAHDKCVAEFNAVKREADRAYAARHTPVTASAEQDSSASVSLESAIDRVVGAVKAAHGAPARKAIWSAVLNKLRGPEVEPAPRNPPPPPPPSPAPAPPPLPPAVP